MPKEWPKNYFSLIFTTQRKNSNYMVFNELSNKYLSLVQNQPGFLGIEIVREDNGLGIEISYWRRLKNYSKVIKLFNQLKNVHLSYLVNLLKTK